MGGHIDFARWGYHNFANHERGYPDFTDRCRGKLIFCSQTLTHLHHHPHPPIMFFEWSFSCKNMAPQGPLHNYIWENISA